MKTDSTSWSQLNAEIDQYKKRGKINLQKYQKKRFNILYKKKQQKTSQSLSSLQIPIKMGYSVNLIREWKHNQVQKTQRIVNKMSFLKVQRDRKIQSTQRARDKLSRVLSIRSTSSQQRNYCENQIKQFKINNYQRKRQLNQRIKSEKAKIDLQRKKILSQNSFKAKQVRSESIQNQETIKKQKQQDISLKQKCVQKGQKQYENNILKKKQRQKTVVQDGKKNHLNYIRQQYLKYERNKRINEQVFKRFQNQSKRIIQQTQRAHNNLLVFEKMLMLRKRSQSINSNSRDENKSTPITQVLSQQNSVEKQKKKINNFFHLTN